MINEEASYIIKSSGINCYNKGAGSTGDTSVVGISNGYHRIMRYKIEIPIQNPDTQEPITTINSIQINFGGNTYGFGYGSSDTSNIIADNLYCFFSTSEYEYKNDNSFFFNKEGIKIKYDKNNNTFPYTDIINNPDLKAGTTYYLYVYGKIDYYNWVYWGGSNAYTEVTLNYTAATECVSPTRIFCDLNICAPNNITVKWQGAIDGISNPIKGYKYGYSFDQEKVPEPIAKTEGSSVNIQVNETERGKKLYFYIQAISEKGDYSDENNWSKNNYDGAVNSNLVCSINILPKKPIIQSTNLTVPSTSTLVVFDATAGTDQDGQKTSLWYTKDDTEIYYEYKNGIYFELEKTSANYKFYSFDGLEYSSSVDVTVKRNTQPKISITVDAKALIGYRDSKVENSEVYDYVINPEITISNSNKQNNRYNFYVRFNQYGPDYAFQMVDILMSNVGGITSTVFSPGDIRNYLPKDIVLPCFYQVFCVSNDGIENSQKSFSENWYYLAAPHFESFENFCNTEGWENKCGKRLRANFYLDQGFSESYIPGRTSNATLYKDNDTLMHVDFVLPEALEQTEIVLKEIKLTNSSTRFEWSFIFDGNGQRYLQVATPQLTNLQLGSDGKGVIKPYTHMGNSYAFNPGGLNSNTKESYGFIKDQVNPKVALKNGETYGDFKNGTFFSNDGDVFNFTLDPEDLYLALPQNLEKKGEKEIEFEVSLINIFGDVTKCSTKFVADFREPIEVLIDDNSYINSYEYSIKQWNYLMEGMPITGQIRIKSYNLIDQNTECYCGDIPFLLEPPRIIGQENSYYKKPVTYEIPITRDQKIPVINKDNIVDVKIIVKTDDDNATEATLYRDVMLKGYREPKISLTKANQSNGNLYIEWQMDDLGFSGSEGLKEKLSIYRAETEEEEVFFEFTQETQTTNSYTLSFDFGDYSFLHLAPILTTTMIAKLNNGNNVFYSLSKSTKKEGYQYVIVYNTVPTIAYRPNQLGINILDPTKYSNAAVVVGAHTGKNLIVFPGEGIEKATLDLSTGSLSGFIVDCGSWDIVDGTILLSVDNEILIDSNNLYLISKEIDIVDLT